MLQKNQVSVSASHLPLSQQDRAREAREEEGRPCCWRSVSMNSVKEGFLSDPQEESGGDTLP